jgi:hypothetical protein
MGMLMTSAQIAPSNNPARTGGSRALEVSGTVNEPTQVTIGGQPANALWKRSDGQYGFRGTAQVSSGANQIAVTATDSSGNQSQATIDAQVSGTAIPTVTYDDFGNLPLNGTRRFDWDAAGEYGQIFNHTLTIVKHGSANLSQSLSAALPLDAQLPTQPSLKIHRTLPRTVPAVMLLG